jgi:acyl-[acyl-carrier-protein]-phospholipid O-acyltransferase/long-chain-fatty-acid--[acyl-carrier-protein] ligase
VGGESVSLAIAENCAVAVWPDHRHASVAIPNDRKGEQIVLLTTNPDAKRSELIAWAQANGIAEIALPRRIFYAAEIPLLGTGKPHYRCVDAIIREKMQSG